jgi:thioredoxin reductase (NADPH)
MLRFQEHCQEFGLEVRTGEVEALRDAGTVKMVRVDGEEVAARTVIITSGAEPRKLEVLGEAAFVGRGVSYCATCDGAFFKNVEVAVVGGGDTAAEEALFLTRFASRVHLIHRRDTLRATAILQERIKADPKIEIHWDTTIDAVVGDPSGVTAASLRHLKSGELRELPLQGIFVAIGVVPKAHFLAEVLTLDADGHILTDAECRTSMTGVFAAGDVRKKILKQIATAVGDGAVAAIMAEKYLMDQ